MGRKGDLTKQRIKNQAMRLFAERGFKDVTMKDVCEVARLSRGGLYLHYESTRQIFSEIVDDLMNAQKDEFCEKIAQGVSAKVILLQVLERYKKEMADAQYDFDCPKIRNFRCRTGNHKGGGASHRHSVPEPLLEKRNGTSSAGI